MNPLPKVVIVALAICSHHYHGASFVGTGDPNVAQCIRTANCGMGGITWGMLHIEWDTGYGKCETIYENASRVMMGIFMTESAAAERAERARKLAAAKKDQGALDAALAALKR